MVAPTEKATESIKTTSFKGWDFFNPDMEFVRNEDGLIVLDGAYNKHWTNGFLVASTGIDFLSFHSGEPVWVDGKQVHITVTHDGKEYAADFAWCSHMGEIGVNFSISKVQQGKSGVRYVSPIPGNDQFVMVGITDGKSKFSYLLNLETLELVDPLANLNPKYSRDMSVDISPGADRAIVYIDSKPAILELASGAVKDLSKSSGLENADTAYWASATQIVVVTTRCGMPQDWYADAVLYDLTDGTVKELYNNQKYAWFRDAGGLEHHGRMYCYCDSEIHMVVFVDSVSGTQGTLSYVFPTVNQMGGYGMEYYDNGICYLLKPDGTVTPLFTTNDDL